MLEVADTVNLFSVNSILSSVAPWISTFKRIKAFLCAHLMFGTFSLS